MDILYIRGLERLLIVSAGILCIILGFLLFKQSYGQTTASSGEMTAKGGGIELSIKNLWPGVFFAAFGMLILVTSIATQLYVDAPKTEEGMFAMKYQGGGLPPEETKSKAIAAIGVIGELLAVESLMPNDIEQKRRMLLAWLNTTQIDLIDIAYGNGSYAKFVDILSKSKTQLEYNQLSDADRRFFEDLRTALQK